MDKLRGQRKKAGNKPLTAAFLSLLVWGGGQIYNKQFGLGVLFIILMGDVIAFTLMVSLLHFHLGRLGLPWIVPPVSRLLLYKAGLIIIVIFWIYNVLQAYYTAFILAHRPRKRFLFH